MSRILPQLLIADQQGKTYNLPHLQATGMKAGVPFPLTLKELIQLPSGSELFRLAQRRPIGYDPKSRSFTVIKKNPFSKKAQQCFAVSAFVSPGFTVSYSASYRENKRAKTLPLFAYAAVCFYRGKFYAAALRIDRERRQDLRLMQIGLVRKNVAKLSQHFARNRLIRHLGTCALNYGCPAAKNLFLSRYEAPLPASPYCNARCIGCISLQPGKKCPATQPRIKFIPTAEEIAQVALFHLGHVQDPVVSFGQGCEGEPLLAAEVLEESIKLIRRKTSKGIINLNTNASRSKALAGLFKAGLDSIRVSLNSLQPKYYTRYFKPQDYGFADVMRSIKLAKSKKRFVSINYLTLPGFTDTAQEFSALKRFLKNYRIDMIQWRNLNFDPLQYFRELNIAAQPSGMLSVREMIKELKKDFPDLMMGYFNPSRMRIKRKSWLKT